MNSASAEIGQSAARTAVFTIVSRNYFHFALNLMASVAAHLPGCRRVVAICDEIDGLHSPDPGIELVAVDQLGIDGLDRMAVYYTILELNTAIKPSVFRWLLKDAAVEKVIYFDPDIQLYSSGAGLLEQLDNNDVVLTPHLLAPLEDDRHPSDLQILQSGTYNLGFLALKRSPDTQRLLVWWQKKLVHDCVVDIPRGLFTDQKWMDLVPGFFERAHVERHPGWNVAYWNLAHRQVDGSDGAYSVNGQALFFFHFSGYDTRTASISKHQDRYRLVDCSPAVRQLFARYTQDLGHAGRERYAALPYAFARLADGTALPDCARHALRRHLDWNGSLPPLRTAAGARWLVDFLTAPVDERQPPISRLGWQLYEDRDDLRAAFPDMLSCRREAFRAWFAERAGPEAGVSGLLAAGMTTARAQPGQQAGTPPGAEPSPGQPAVAMTPALSPMPAAAAAAALPVAAAAAANAPVLPYRLAYRLAYKARHMLRPMTTLQFRARLRSHLLQRAFPASPSGPAPLPAVAQAAAARLPRGVTVIGYVKAESGVGESARATLRALATTDLPHSLVDFQTGNVSRMAEEVDETLVSGLQHAISLLHINADQLPGARTFLGEAAFAGPYRIGYWAWELETFPEQWHGAYDHVDEIWVPSTFCQRAIAAPSPVPVLVMPHAVEIPAQLAPDRAAFGLHPDTVVFLVMADMMSIAGRKNPNAAVQAYVAAFGQAHNGSQASTQLLVKISNADRDPEAFARLQALATNCPGIRLLTEAMDRPVLNRLLDTVDCFVSLHRAEGFGLVIAEAMARGKVVLATGWSGNMDFMSAANSLPVDYRLVTLDSDAGPYLRGERWAEPSHEDAVAKLRLVASDPALRQRLGARARLDCAAQLSPRVVGQLVRERLELICQRQATSIGG